MNIQDKLTIIVRLFGVYSLWQVIISFVGFFSLSLMSQQTTSTSRMFDVFSGGSASNTPLLGLITCMIQAALILVLLISARKIAAWISHDIRERLDTHQASDDNSTLALSVTIIGLVLFALGIRDLTKSLPSFMLTIESPFTSSIFVLYLLQMLFSVFLIFRPSQIVKVINRFRK